MYILKIYRIHDTYFFVMSLFKIFTLKMKFIINQLIQTDCSTNQIIFATIELICQRKHILPCQRCLFKTRYTYFDQRWLAVAATGAVYSCPDHINLSIFVAIYVDCCNSNRDFAETLARTLRSVAEFLIINVHVMDCCRIIRCRQSIHQSDF